MEKINIGGWKTKTGAAAMVLLGAGSVLQGVSLMLDGDFEGGVAMAKGGIASAAMGLATFGIGHKIAKAAAVK